MNDCTFSIVHRLQNIPARLSNVVRWYVFSLMIETQKHTLIQAQEISGLNRRQFSRLLDDNSDLAERTLLELVSQNGKPEYKKKKILVKGTPWTIAIIIDSTLHPQSALHIQNSQRHNHGAGFVIGHQWTNILIVVGDQALPLPPIPFYSKNECKRRGIEYRTEHEVLQEYQQSLQLSKYVGSHDPHEVVVLADSGYDNKKQQSTILQDLGWSFVFSLKNTRGCHSMAAHHIDPKCWQAVTDLFWTTRKYAPWGTVRTQVNGGKKRKEFRARRIDGYIKGVHALVAIVQSEKIRGIGRRHLVSSNPNISTGAIIRTYKIRWLVEQFHRATKDNLGLTDAGVHDFDSLINHVHWVYVAYVLIMTQADLMGFSLPVRQRRLRDDLNRMPLNAAMKEIVRVSTRYGGIRSIRSLAKSAIQEKTAA